VHFPGRTITFPRKDDIGSRRGRYGFPGRTIFVPGRDDKVSSQGRYVFPGRTIRSGWEISHRRRCSFPGRTILRGQLTSRAAPRLQLGATRAIISSQAGRYRPKVLEHWASNQLRYLSRMIWRSLCKPRFLEEDDIGRAPRRRAAAYLLSVEIASSREGCRGHARRPQL
jgi:hypothetical protein